MTDKNKIMAYNRIKNELDKVSAEMLPIITKYNVEASSPLDVIESAKKSITNQDDYIRFLELSLQGRLLGEAVSHLGLDEQEVVN